MYKSLLVLILIAVNLMGCDNEDTEKINTQQQETVIQKGEENMNEPILFEKMILDINNSMAESDEYEIIKTENGVKAVRYFGNWSDEKDKENYIEKEIEGDEELYNEIVDLITKCDIKKWDKFAGEDPDVLDGGGFSFKAELSDGTKIFAHGSNAYPQNYWDFCNGLKEIVREEK